MGIVNFFKSLLPRNRTTVSLGDAELLQWLGIDPDNTKAISEVTYYTCIRMLAETLGKLPMHYYQQTSEGKIRAEPNEATQLLTIRPNDYMTPTTLWTLTEMNCQMYGNAFIWIDRQYIPARNRVGGRVAYQGLYPMNPADVTIWVDDGGIFGKSGAIHYEYRNPKTGKSYLFDSYDVMHFRTWYSRDGLTGVPVREILAETIDGAAASQKVMNTLYKNGMTAKMVMQYTADLDDERVAKLRKKFADKLTGVSAAGKVIPIPDGLKLEPLNVSLADSQFFELKKYTALQIAAAFGIKPNQINDYDKSSYASSEMQQIAFLVDTMMYRLKMYEEEINAKFLRPSEKDAGFFYKFNSNAILRVDSKTQADILQSYVNNAIYTPNEARDFLSMPAAEGGDILMCNGNYIPVTSVSNKGVAPEEGGADNGTN